MPRSEKTRILIANGRSARWIERRRDHPDFVTVGETRFEDAEAAVSRVAVHERAGSGAHHGGADEDVSARNLAGFGRELAQRLNDQHRRREFGRLALVAPPRLLRHLLDGLDDATRASLVFQLGKDLTHAGNHDLKSWLHGPEFL